jgi:hypothetical protein
MRQVRVVAAEAAFADQGGDLGGEQHGAFGGGIDHHARKPRRQRQPAQLSPLLGDAAVAFDGAEFGQQRLGLGEHRARRRIEEGEVFGCGAPGGEVEGETGKVGGKNFRPGMGLRAPRSAAHPKAGAAGGGEGLSHLRQAQGPVDYAFHLIIPDPSEQVTGQELPALIKDGYTSFKIYTTYDSLKLDMPRYCAANGTTVVVPPQHRRSPGCAEVWRSVCLV